MYFAGPRRLWPRQTAPEDPATTAQPAFITRFLLWQGMGRTHLAEKPAEQAGQGKKLLDMVRKLVTQFCGDGRTLQRLRRVSSRLT